MSDTPETDRLTRDCYNGYAAKCTELIYLCRKLERERDEARDSRWAREIHSCHNACARPICTLRRERDEARKALHDLMEEYENRFA